jgi:hypothetical protein
MKYENLTLIGLIIILLYTFIKVLNYFDVNITTYTSYIFFYLFLFLTKIILFDVYHLNDKYKLSL